MTRLLPWRRESEAMEFPFRSLRTEMDRLFRDFLGDDEFSLAPRFAWANRWPAVDLAETPETFVLQADLPGLETKDIDIQVSGDILTISGRKTEEKKEEGKNLLVSERAYGEWKRSFRLPAAADAERIEATMHNGVLKLTIGKVAEAKPKMVKVKPV